MTNPHAADVTTAARFVEALAPSGGITFQTFDDSREKRAALASVTSCTAGDPAALRGALARLAKRNAQGAGIFVAVNATDGRGRRADNVRGVRALFVDLDDPARPFDPQAFGLPPSLVVESSPGKRHVYWVLDDLADEFPLSEFTPAQQCIARAFGGDPSCTDLPRVLRVPGFVHRKGDPFVSRLVLDDGPRYSVAELRAWVATLPSPPTERTPTDAPAQAHDPGGDMVPPETLDGLRAALAHLVERQKGVQSRRDAWVRQGERLKTVTGGRELWMEHSASLDGWDHDEAAQQWETFMPCRTGYAAIFKEAQAAGWVNPRSAAGRELAEASQPPDPVRFRFQQAAAFIDAPPLRWLVRGLLPQAEIGVIYGASKAGKTFFVLDVVAAIARGVPWRGRRVRQGVVAYVCAEGAGGFRLRVQAYAQHHGADLAALPLHVLGDAPNLMEAGDVRDLVAALQALPELAAVVIDTLAQTTPGANENSGEDMGRALGHCKVLHRETGAMVLLVAHSGKDEGRGVRGWSGVLAAMDVAIRVERLTEHDRAAVVDKLKDGAGEGEGFPFRLLGVTLGHDEDGEDVTSCVIEEAAHVPASMRRAEPKGKWQQLVLRVAQTLADLDPVVTTTQLIEAAVSQMVQPDAGKRDTRRQRAIEAVDGLAAAGALSTAGGRVEVL